MPKLSKAAQFKGLVKTTKFHIPKSEETMREKDGYAAFIGEDGYLHLRTCRLSSKTAQNLAKWIYDNFSS